MAATFERIERVNNDNVFSTMDENLSAPGATEPVRLNRGDVVVQLAGTGTVTAVIERATRDPNSDPNWAPADTGEVTGDLADGLPVMLFSEPTLGWWRVRVTACSGTVQVHISGESA